MEHCDLIAEMIHIEHMSTQERLHLARRRRLQQLKYWVQRERERNKKSKQNNNNSNIINNNKIKKHIFFSDNVMLLEAASRNDIQEVRRLLTKGVSPDSTNEDGLTALHQCCIDNNEEMMKLLIEFKANVNAEDSEKWTPLHAAATCGHLPLVKYLINHGANLLAVNADGNMPYDICEDETALDHIESEMARRGVTQELIDETRASTETNMLKDLIEQAKQGADLEWRDAVNATPLHIAAANGYLRVVEFLLDQHVSTDVKDKDGWQPVHAAACWGHLEILEILVQNGADLNAKTKHDETPADICEDPELRERIVTLKTEQESKKIQEAQRKRVKRTQSNNTRAQSVRRTSIRDKTLITKKDTLEEARLRLQAANNALDLANELNLNSISSNSTTSNHTNPTTNNNNNNHTTHNIPNNINKYPLQLQSTNTHPLSNTNKYISTTSRCEPDGMDATLQNTENNYSITNNNLYSNSPNSTLIKQNNLITSQRSDNILLNSQHNNDSILTSQRTDNLLLNSQRNNDSLLTSQRTDDLLNLQRTDNLSTLQRGNNLLNSPTETSSTYSTEDNGKINIHVSVTINTGTLAELKKQRAQTRTICSSNNNTQTLNSSTNSCNGVLQPGVDNNILNTTTVVKRFAGNTEEDQVIGDIKNEQNCCRLM